jgi:uncharacterized membrane protein (UPF0127 family)
VIEIRSDEWASGPLRVAGDRRSRRRGMRPRPGRHGLVLGARSMHTFGMRTPIGVVAVDSTGRVVASRVVPPRRVWTVRSAAAMIEVAAAGGLPKPGTMLTALRVARSEERGARGEGLYCDR